MYGFLLLKITCSNPGSLLPFTVMRFPQRHSTWDLKAGTELEVTEKVTWKGGQG